MKHQQRIFQTVLVCRNFKSSLRFSYQILCNKSHTLNGNSMQNNHGSDVTDRCLWRAAGKPSREAVGRQKADLICTLSIQFRGILTSWLEIRNSLKQTHKTCSRVTRKIKYIMKHISAAVIRNLWPPSFCTQTGPQSSILHGFVTLQSTARLTFEFWKYKLYLNIMKNALTTYEVSLR
jgi:hypothetical protein